MLLLRRKRLLRTMVLSRSCITSEVGVVELRVVAEVVSSEEEVDVGVEMVVEVDEAVVMESDAVEVGVEVMASVATVAEAEAKHELNEQRNNSATRSLLCLVQLA